MMTAWWSGEIEVWTIKFQHYQRVLIGCDMVSMCWNHNLHGWWCGFQTFEKQLCMVVRWCWMDDGDKNDLECWTIGDRGHAGNWRGEKVWLVWRNDVINYYTHCFKSYHKRFLHDVIRPTIYKSQSDVFE